MMILNGTDFSKDLILWQNTRECHHCSWVRSRDKLGHVIPVLMPNQTYIAWVDTRWPQRFRLAKEASNNTDYQGLKNRDFTQIKIFSQKFSCEIKIFAFLHPFLF